MKIAIGTKNPTKVNAVKETFSIFHDVTFFTLDVSSGVSPQPITDEETIHGAINRANNVLREAVAEIGIGLEGGIVETNIGIFLCNWGALAASNEDVIIAGGSRILLPDEVGRAVLAGRELGDVMDDYTNTHNIRQNEGAIGIFTNGLVNRTEMFTELSKLLLGQYLYKTNKAT
ncbi:DUF84 family protein [Metabacillus fastidiosus]|uniref:DUF84 family protein n=1 Tax=Metabacillus fastidiosus TaxID=1458 RepID=UPI002DBCEBF9|nr:DUF84 family protein [Metabacillus fastidiosus]MEC2077415.1 DUF84 family protein [Metabacillus fastidiosus]